MVLSGILAASLFLLCGCGLCFGVMNAAGSSTSKKTLTTYYGNSKVIAARYFQSGGGEEMTSEELPAEKLDKLVETLDSMKLKGHLFHTDYYWGGQFGIELDLEDGTYLTYDGTMLEHRSTSILTDKGSGKPITSNFLEVTNCEFWEEMKPFFSTINENMISSW